MKQYDVAAFVWPAYTGDEERTRIFWPEGIGKEFYPHVSIGWDNNPRFFTFRPDIITGNTPEAFAYALQKAKEYCDRYNEVPLITINSWNEWTETSYLEPDNVYGYGYLEAVKRVFCTKT